jgi:hypothetical protein
MKTAANYPLKMYIIDETPDSEGSPDYRVIAQFLYPSDALAYMVIVRKANLPYKLYVLGNDNMLMDWDDASPDLKLEHA